MKPKCAHRALGVGSGFPLQVFEMHNIIILALSRESEHAKIEYNMILIPETTN